MKPLLILSIILFFNSCIQSKPDAEYYVISEHEYKPSPGNDSIPPPPPPPPPPAHLEWYSDLVMIFDTSDLIYLYQTECEFFRRGGIEQELAPRFIGLNPDHLVVLRSRYIMDFLHDNDNVFMLDKFYRYKMRILHLASVSDTIKNPTFYAIRNKIKDNIEYRMVYCMIRRTTEEENTVLSFKKSGQDYNPKDWKWSENFIDGHCSPFSERYEYLVNASGFIIRAKETFDPGQISMNMVLE
ncbi:MAG: hypothetical protein JXA77_13265 [Bacteroidales bacterium]|nr:hypothetical protein [Bacteroidales bacterium]